MKRRGGISIIATSAAKEVLFEYEDGTKEPIHSDKHGGAGPITMRRRELILLLGGAAMRPLSVRAQQKAMPVIGTLSAGPPGANASFWAAFRQGLSETGFVEGQNAAIDYRWAEGS